MGKKDSDVIQAFGISAEMLQALAALANEIKSQGGEVADIRCLEEKIVRTEVAKLLIQVSQCVRNIFHLVVDYSLSLVQMIAAGNYDLVNSDITAEHFPISGSGKQAVEVELWHPNQYFKNGDEVIAKFEQDKPDYRFTTLPELLVLGAVKPELQRQFPIAALGSSRRDSSCFRHVPYLYWDGSERFLYLCRLEDVFSDGWRFAVVRKVPS